MIHYGYVKPCSKHIKYFHMANGYNSVNATFVYVGKTYQLHGNNFPQIHFKKVLLYRICVLVWILVTIQKSSKLDLLFVLKVIP